MKIIKNNYGKNQKDESKVLGKYPKAYFCEECESEFEYDKDDMYYGEYGCAFVDCPCCGEKILLKDEDGLTLTVDNVQFPDHFGWVSAQNGAVDRCNNDIVKTYIEKAIRYFRKNPEEYAWQARTGNVNVTVFNDPGDSGYYVTVSNEYYHTFIPYGVEDFFE